MNMVELKPQMGFELLITMVHLDSSAVALSASLEIWHYAGAGFRLDFIKDSANLDWMDTMGYVMILTISLVCSES